MKIYDSKSSAEMYELYQSIYSSEVENLSEEVDIDEARLGEPGTRLRSASERTRRTQTSAQKRAQERERGIRRAEENVLADIQALAKGKKETNSSSVNSNSSASTSSVKARKLKTGQKKDTLAAKASDILSQIRNEENEIDEARVRKIDRPTKDDLEAVKDMPLSHKARMAKNQKAIEDMKTIKNPNKLFGKAQIDAMNRRLRGEELEIDEAQRDYDGDGKIESGSKEHAGVVHNAIRRKKGLRPDGQDTRREEIFNDVYSYLIDEGYADTDESAYAIMCNMSEEWIDDILEATRSEEGLSADEKRELRRQRGRAVGHLQRFTRGSKKERGRKTELLGSDKEGNPTSKYYVAQHKKKQAQKERDAEAQRESDRAYKSPYQSRSYDR